MGIPIKETITLRTARGVAEAVVREVGTRELQVEGKLSYKPGREVEFQFPLPGYNANLRGRAKVTKVVTLALGPTQAVLDIVEMNKNHEGMLREWLLEHERAVRTNKPKKRPAPSVEQMRSGGSGSLISTLNEADDAVGRQAITEIIASSADGGESRRSRLRRGVEARRGTNEQPGKPKRGHLRVEVKVASNATPPIVQIRFNDPQRYDQYYWKHIHRLALQVRYTGTQLEKNARVSVRLVLPGGSLIKCTGVVKVTMPTGFGLLLDMDHTARSTLRLAAGQRPRDV